VADQFAGAYDDADGVNRFELFDDNLSKLLGIERPKKFRVLMHVCLYIYNKDCKWWFEEIIKIFMSINLRDYVSYLLWNDEGIDNVLRWKYGFKKYLQLTNFDTSGYDGNQGFTDRSMNQFYKFWNEDGPQNFNRIYGYQFIPEDKSKIIWFHGNKNIEISSKMIEFIKLKRNNNFHQSYYFYTDIYKLENFENVYDILGSTVDIAATYGWPRAMFHEIYNLRDYYCNREKRIHDGDIVVDVGANIGIFTRWAYQEGASKVISFEPDRRYFKLLKLNSDPRTILFNAAVSDSIGTITLHESEHLGGSNVFFVPGSTIGYEVRAYTLNHLFESGLVDKIDFLKIDTEGSEINILKGISDENLMKVKNIAMEYHNSQFNYDENLRGNLIGRLNRLGFNSFLLFMGDNNVAQMIYFWR
jgi:FkbM family methyltransferase